MKEIYTRDTLLNVEEVLIQEEQIEAPIKHHFSPGVYIREITMPRDSIILGHEHTTKHLNIISKGSCILSDVATGTQEVITAPYTFESDKGVRKLLYILEECVWSTVHVTEETDLDKLEENLIVKSVVYLDNKEQLCLG